MDVESPPEAPASKTAALSGTAPLRLRLEFSAGTVTVTRAGRSFALGKKDPLRPRDVLGARRGLVLRFPGDQWVVLHGRLRLDRAPRVGERSLERVEVTLLAGEARLRATPAGRGVLVRAAERTCLAESGELRLRLTPAGLRVEAITAYATLRGPHASRTLPEGSGILLGREVGFSQVLLPGPRELQPVTHAGPAAPELRWEPVSGATAYRVSIGAEPLFWRVEESATVRIPRYRPRLRAPGKHFWQVVPLRGEEGGAPSKIYSFDIRGQNARAP